MSLKKQPRHSQRPPQRVARTGVLFLFFMIGCSLDYGAAQEVSLQRGQDLLKRGNYKEAVAVFSALLDKSPRETAAQVGLIRALIETGDYSAAESKAAEFLKQNPADGSVEAALGEVLFQTGRYADAAAVFQKASRRAKGATWLRSLLGQARALLARGLDEQAREALQQLITYYNSSSPTSAEELTLIARGLVYLEKFRDANDLYIDAREADPEYVEAFLWQGELLNEKYAYGEAASLFRDALKINPNSADARVGLAHSKRLESNEEPQAEVERALAVNPNHTGALVLRAWLDLESDKAEAAEEMVRRALQVAPGLVDAIAVRAATLYLADRQAELEAETRRALAINPRAGGLFSTLAHFAVINRRYADSVEFGRRAVELSPRLWAARTELGIQLLRVGREAEGRAELERAFTGDPFNVWAKNSLDLLDSMREFRDTVRGPFLIRAAARESDVVAPYAADLVEDAYQKLVAKYRFTPRGPIGVELFSNHEDFAVRSLGLPGLGALGVCFGQVVAMDSPLAREAGSFNWGSTLWHEFAHVITLQISSYRIPRWFSEGLSVFEERRARPGWGDDWSLPWLKAFKEGRFAKIADMEAAFTRPRSPDGVPLAYFQASMICEYLEERFGFDAILRMLALYKQGLRTPEVFERALSVKPDEFDRSFNEYVGGKAGPYLDAIGAGPGNQRPSKEALLAVLRARPNDFFANLGLGSLLKSEGDNQSAIGYLKRAAELIPFYVGEGNPYVQLADIYESQGRKAEAAAALDGLVRFDEENLEAQKRLARLRLELDDRAGALDALKACFYIYPFDVTLHKQAGDVYLEQGNAAAAVREFSVVAALDPPDLAGAHYDIARASLAAGKAAEARRAVLRALEIAPGFEKAQELLLKLRRSNP